MGLNTTVFILNDAIPEIEHNPTEFVQNLIEAINLGGDNRDFRVGGTSNGARVVVSHHADYVSVIAVGANYSTILGTVYNGNKGHHKEEDRYRILNEVIANAFLLHKCGPTPDIVGTANVLLNNLTEKMKALTESHQELFEACQAVVDNWSTGDLAAAARQCQAAIDNIPPTKKSGSWS